MLICDQKIMNWSQFDMHMLSRVRVNNQTKIVAQRRSISKPAINRETDLNYQSMGLYEWRSCNCLKCFTNSLSCEAVSSIYLWNISSKKNLWNEANFQMQLTLNSNLISRNVHNRAKQNTWNIEYGNEQCSLQPGVWDLGEFERNWELELLVKYNPNLIGRYFIK